MNRDRLGRWPQLERLESRELLSAITDIMASDSLHSAKAIKASQILAYPTPNASSPSQVHAAVAGGGGHAGGGGGGSNNASPTSPSPAFAPFMPITTAPVIATGQGPQGINYAINPAGNQTKAELKREQFSAYFQGTYTIFPGRFNTEASNTLIQAAGHGSTFLHGDITLRIIKPTATVVGADGRPVPLVGVDGKPVQLGGVAAIFDRNLNSNSVLGLDAAGASVNVDAAGRPIYLDTLSIDVNESSGLYDEAIAGAGDIAIQYLPFKHHPLGTLDKGHVIVKIVAQIYTPNVDYILQNSNINPGGPPP